MSPKTEIAQPLWTFSPVLKYCHGEYHHYALRLVRLPLTVTCDRCCLSFCHVPLRSTRLLCDPPVCTLLTAVRSFLPFLLAKSQFPQPLFALHTLAPQTYQRAPSSSASTFFLLAFKGKIGPVCFRAVDNTSSTFLIPLQEKSSHS